jgi:hypothetical protein
MKLDQYLGCAVDLTMNLEIKALNSWIIIRVVRYLATGGLCKLITMILPPKALSTYYLSF